MAELTSNILDNFSDFLYSPKPGGTTDIFSDTDKVLIQKKINEGINVDATYNFLEITIQKSEEIQTQIRGMIKDIEKKPVKSLTNSQNFFKNSFPFGEVEINTNESLNKLKSIENTTFDQMKISSNAFARLCKMLLPKIYKDQDSDILMDIFGSISDYSVINLNSNGMMSISSLFKLFDEFYMNYNTTKSGISGVKTYLPNKTGIDKQKFFNRFLEVSSMQLRNREVFDDKSFKSTIDDIFEFNPDLWYADFRLDEEFDKNRVYSLSDSYAAFFRAPGLDTTTSSGSSFTLGTELKNFDEYGAYNRITNTTPYLNKNFCLLFQENSNGNILDNYKLPKKFDYSINSELLNLLYNSSNFTHTSIQTDQSFIYPSFIIPQSTPKYFQTAEITQQFFNQNGGSKKKLKGGTSNNLLDTNSLPNLKAKRSPRNFNPIIFEKSVRRFYNERGRYIEKDLNTLISKMMSLKKLPIFYHDLKQELGNPKINYEEIRFIFHLSSVYTTYKKLLIHFLQNIMICYNHYSTIVIPSFIKDSKNVSNSVMSIPSRIEILIKYIRTMISKLNINLLETGKKIDIRDLFCGFKITNVGIGQTNIPNILEDKYFKDYCLLGIMPNIFKQFIQIFCLENKIYFGGIPFTLSIEAFNKNIQTCYKFFLQYRYLSNGNLIELLKVLKNQNQQKPTKQEYDTIVAIVKQEFDEIMLSVRSLNPMEQNRMIVQKTIEFGIKHFIKTLNSIQIKKSRNNVTKSTSRLSKPTSNKTSSNNSNFSINTHKIGEFKQKIYNFLYKLKDNNLVDQNLYLFLYGQLFQFIYRIDEVMNYNEKMTPQEFKIKFESLGIDLEMTDGDIQQKAKQITSILTDPVKSLKLKSRFFGLFTPKEALTNNAKRLLPSSFDSDALKPHWWVDIEKQYLKFSGNRRLFVIAIEPSINLGKLSKLNIWLIDVFATVQSQMKPITRNYVKTFEEVGENGIVKKEYYGDNQMIMLNPYFRIMREFKGELQKFVTKDPTWWKDISGKKKTFFRNLFQSKNKAARLQKSEFGRLLADYLGIRKKDKNGEEGFKNSEILTRLIQGKLDSYVESNNGSTKLKFSLLMGYDEAQLNEIIRRQLETMSKEKRYSKEAKSYDDWQLYLIESKDYSSIEAFRMWAFNLLMSKPWIFNQEQISGKYNIVPISNFSKMQVPFKNFFVKIGDFGISSVLLDFFKLITEETFKNSKNIRSIKEKRLFIPQVDLSELEIPRNSKNLNLVEGINRNFVNNVNKSLQQSTALAPPNLYTIATLPMRQHPQLHYPSKFQSVLSPVSSSPPQPFSPSFPPPQSHSQSFPPLLPPQSSSVSLSSRVFPSPSLAFSVPSSNPQQNNICHQTYSSPLSQFLYNFGINKQNNNFYRGFSVDPTNFANNIPTCIFSFKDDNNIIILEIAICIAPANNYSYYCRINNIGNYLDLIYENQNTLKCAQYEIKIFLSEQLILKDNEVLSLNNGQKFFWEKPPVGKKVNNNSKIKPEGFSNWVNYCKDQVSNNNYLLKYDPSQIPATQEKIVLQFLDKNNAILIQISILNGKYILYYSKATGAVKQFEIKKEDKTFTPTYFVKWRPFGSSRANTNTVTIEFNQDPNNLITKKTDPYKEEKLVNNGNGYEFREIGIFNA
jgi:hypothetical protein